MLQLNARTLDLYDELRDTGVSFEMHTTGLLFAARTEAGLTSIRKQFAMLAETGWSGQVEDWDRGQIEQEEPALGEGVTGALLAPDERHVRPESLVRGLVDAVRTEGVTTVEHVTVDALTRRNGSWSVDARGDAYPADKVVVAAGVWTANLMRTLRVRLPIQAAKGYSVTANGSGTKPRRPLYLEEAKIGLSPFRDGTRITGTLELAGIDLELNTRRLGALLRGAGPYLRDWQPQDPRVEWTGLRPLAPDGLPVIGALPGQDGLFVATGHGTLGVTLAPATAALLSPLVLEGKLGASLSPFQPARFG